MRLGPRLPFHGHVVWLTREQGGRDSGPPPTPTEQDFAATGFVPPATAESGLASFVLRVEDRQAWWSRADANWLIVENTGPYEVKPGDVVVVTEGAKVVAYFHVDTVDDSKVAQDSP
jgi:hypothetical protein